MFQNISALDLSDEYVKYVLDIEAPGKCPRCNNGVSAIIKGAYVLRDPDEERGHATVLFFVLIVRSCL